MTDPPNHPLVVNAAEGRLPSWARTSESRRAHMSRVSNLLREWAVVRGEDDDEIVRWAAVGTLHDVLRDGESAELRQIVGLDFRDLPSKALHGPAAAARLRSEGVSDEGLLLAVAYHTLGHPDLGTLGTALYVADFLEPGRKLQQEWRSGLRDRMPGELQAVVLEIAAARITGLVERRQALRPETASFWSSLVG